jgi:MFS transporter, ACS family, glucarate transporter
MQPDTERPTNIRGRIFALACGTSWLLYLHRYTFSLIKPQLAEEWNLKSDELGLLDSAFSLCYTVFQVPLGVACDAIGVRLILTGMIVVWSIGLGLHAGATTTSALWYARALMGAGQSAVYAALNRISRQWFAPGVRTTLQGFVAATAGRIGGMSAGLLFGTLLVGIFGVPWRDAVYLFTSLGLAHAAAFFIMFRNTPREHANVNEAEARLIAGTDAGSQSASGAPANTAPPMTVRRLFGSLSRRGVLNLVAVNVQTILSTLADNIYSNWIPLFLWQVHRLGDEERGVYSALPLLGGAAAGVIGGLLNDWFIRRTGNRRWSRSGVAMAGKAMASLLLFTALFWYDRPYVFCTFLFFVKLFGDWSLVTTWGVVTDIGGRATATVFAFNNAVAGVALIGAPALFGYMAKEYGWYWVFVTVAATYALCALSWLAINSSIPLFDSKADE